MGVWIETLYSGSIKKLIGVTPYMGVWIETRLLRKYAPRQGSHPVWVCGLKQHSVNSLTLGYIGSHPVWVCGLKQP